ncbi:MAG: TrmO family methyltransferase [Salibaculum sp.]|uniref:TrmO family methyltransferase domain-containing protein n=1 Tax=Salibaculum sp. TaxID=2855480 RepID=UPI00287048F4|nr:TrmO family methyltransferase [Salibaculum sp.]MDR9481382.1 TrmO family methyltransferase [Salibaculum sp.]
MTKPPRKGEVPLGVDPAEHARAGVTFIGTLYTDWGAGRAPRNLSQSRERGGGGGRVVLDAPYRAGLRGLAVGQAIWLILWFDQARRDLIVQAPRHAEGPRGTFALRSPVRPNPIAIEAVRITSLDPETGEIGLDVTDAFDGTPVLDIKPWLDGIDIPPEPEG